MTKDLSIGQGSSGRRHYTQGASAGKSEVLGMTIFITLKIHSQIPMCWALLRISHGYSYLRLTTRLRGANKMYSHLPMNG